MMNLRRELIDHREKTNSGSGKICHTRQQESFIELSVREQLVCRKLHQCLPFGDLS